MGILSGQAMTDADYRQQEENEREEMELIEQMDAVMVPESIWIALGEKVENGDTQAIKTWLSYRYGMPKQMIESTNLNLDASGLSLEEREKRIEELKSKLNDK